MSHQYKFTAVDFDPFGGKEIEKIIRVNDSQKEIWLSCMFGGTNANLAYNESISLRFTGNLDILSFEKSLALLINRHEALRSSFSGNGDNIFIYSSLPANLKIEDLSKQESSTHEKTIEVFIKKEMNTPFVLEEAPLFRFFLQILGNSSFHFTLFSHHIIVDGWSMGVILKDLSALYNTFISKEAFYPPFPAQMSSYTEQQLAFNKTKEYKQTEEYWLNQYKDFAPELNLPINSPRISPRTFKGDRHDWLLNKQLVDDIKQISKKNGSSLVTCLLCAFEIYISHLTNQTEIVIGLPAAGQVAYENFELVGHCVNVMPLKSSINKEDSFAEYLRKRKNYLLDAYDNQKIALGELIKKINIKRDSTKIPLTPVVFNVDLGMDQGVLFQEIEYELLSNKREYEIFDLFLNITESKGNLILEWSYNAQIINSSSILKTIDEFNTLLEKIVSNAEQPIKNYFPASLNKEIQTFKTSEYPSTTIHHLFSEQAKLTPSKTALLFGQQSLSYRELEEKSNQFARYLQKQGVGNETLVAINLNRSIDLIITILGILKSGAAYVPIDTQYPEDRIQYMLEDSKSKIVICHKDTSSAIIKILEKKVILEDTWEQIKKESGNALSEIAGPDNLAYVMYTSGSTGKPKGVMIEHRNVISLVKNIDYVSFSPEKTLLSTGSPSFDATTFEYWGMLLNGGTLVLCEEETLFDNTLLKTTIKNNKIGIMWFTSSLLNKWVNMDITVFEGLQTILAGGEKLSEKHINQIRTKFPDIQLINGYGPTENTTFSLTYNISKNTPNSPIPIGNPLTNRTAYVLDEELQLCAENIVGELYVGGAGIGRGYLNNEQLTAERFIKNPFDNNASNKKLYKTGDLAKLLPNGEIEYVGRIDDQVKLRGFRIELGEIENILCQHNNVEDAIVALLEREEDLEKKLVAYIIPKGSYNKNEIITYLQSKLPDYMVPRIFINIESIPLTKNGKADRKKLTFLYPIHEERDTAFIAPQTPLQEAIASIWQEALGLKQIGLYDDFFALGGHSLLALQSMIALERATGKRVPLASLLNNSTIFKLSQLIEKDQDKLWNCLVPIKPVGSKAPIFFVHGAGLNVLTFREICNYLDPEQPAYGLQAKGLNGKDKPLNKMEDIAELYISEILKVNPNGPFALGGYSFGGMIAFEMAQQLRAQNKEVIFLGLFDTSADQSDHNYPLVKKIITRTNTFFKKIWCTLVLFYDRPLFIFKYRMRSMGIRLKELYSKVKRQIVKENPNDVRVYSRQIIDNLFVAHKNYTITPYDGNADLFRAKIKTSYIEDFEFLNWKPYIKGDLNVHDVPGEHTYIFDEPNVKELAMALQNSLDKAVATRKSVK